MKTNKEKILCIFPEDPSLAFLSTLRNYLEENYNCHFILANDESYNISIDTISSLEPNSLIMFFGHGASHCFYGSCSQEFPQRQLVNSTNIEALKDKNVFALSCRSCDFLDSNKRIIKEFFGFGNMPTDWDEIVAERNTGDPFYLNKMTQEDVEIYKSLLNKIVLQSLKKTEDLLDFRRLYLSIKLSINKEISKLLIEKNPLNYREIANLLFYLKEDIIVSI